MSPLKCTMCLLKSTIVIVMWMGTISCGTDTIMEPPGPKASMEADKPDPLVGLSTETPELNAESISLAIDSVLSTIAAMQTSTPTMKYFVKPTPSPTPTMTPNPTHTPTPTVLPTSTPTLSTVISNIMPTIVRIRIRESDSTSTSSGIIYEVDRSSGAALIITSGSALWDPMEITVILDNSTEYIAQLLGVYREKDLAVLEVCCNQDFMSVTMGDALMLTVGADVISVGSSDESGSGIRVSRGIVSAIRFQSDENRWLIQTDLSVPRDASGSALLTRQGKLVGINTAMLNGIETLSKEGYSFAVSEVTISDTLLSLETGS